ncbi:hypothetical protein UFOVP510_25 [uncultured Caudovirales phage]|uniref:Uncharacterized protein n=1 Tax=uncultured Caudovirales phage TaxID=2100421 RepID=A0A6J5MLA7_9CAUD|nr:hypothetical protein UFOVP510_25 [uncultured Caudovirales phage]
MKNHIIPEAVNGVIIYDASITSIKRKKDTNNCVLRALAVALDLPIDEPGSIASKGSRKYGSGTSNKDCKMLVQHYGLKEVFTQRGSLHGAIPVKAIEIREAIARFPKGRFIISSRKHWFAVIDGCPVDSWDWFNPRKFYSDFETGETIALQGWDHKAYKVYECPPLKG